MQSSKQKCRHLSLTLLPIFGNQSNSISKGVTEFASVCEDVDSKLKANLIAKNFRLAKHLITF